jgi:two-component system chemotaxis response regulator CheB
VLPEDFPIPILVVQHISQGFVQGFATWLNSVCLLHVKVAASGDELKPGVVYVAPENTHMGITKDRRIALSHADPISGFRPSASFTFESVADVFGTSALTVILTGMGQDGVDGLRAVRRSGGFVIAQDEASSVVYGMPGVAASEGLVNTVLPLSAIAATISEMVQPSRM